MYLELSIRLNPPQGGCYCRIFSTDTGCNAGAESLRIPLCLVGLIQSYVSCLIVVIFMLLGMSEKFYTQIWPGMHKISYALGHTVCHRLKNVTVLLFGSVRLTRCTQRAVIRKHAGWNDNDASITSSTRMGSYYKQRSEWESYKSKFH